MIQKVIADHFKMRVHDLKSRNNSQSVAVPRQICMYLCKQLTGASLPQIGREFGNKHHTTVLHSINKIEELRQQDPEFNRQVQSFLESFK
jgi:chromosomal replication initiator protein